MEKWGAERDGEGATWEEPRGLNKKSLYKAAMAKVSIITIYSDKNRISFHINTTKRSPKLKSQFSVLLPSLTE